MNRVAILVGESDEVLGKCRVPDAAVVIQHKGAYYGRTHEGRRLTRVGTGVGVVFRLTEVYIRDKIEPL